MDFSDKNFQALESRFFSGTLRHNIAAINVAIKTSHSGHPVPVLSIRQHSITLHSLYNPVLEAQRIVAQYGNVSGLYVVLGLGGGYHIQEIIKKNPQSKIIIIEKNIKLFYNLIQSIDYSDIFSNANVFLYVDYVPEAFDAVIKEHFNYIFDTYCYTIPLRSRINFDNHDYFSACSLIIESTIRSIASDIAVQAQFGFQWLKNILKNIMLLKHNKNFTLPKPRVMITGAGPSLDSHETIEAIKNQLHTHWLLATDTSVGFLLAHNIVPDAIISIDCQLYSMLHFKHAIPETTTLFLDIASPSSLARKYANVLFFGSYHPLCVYFSKQTNAFPLVDCSGGNVLYAACELVAMLGANLVTVYGADFSYPQGSLYARGTYLYDMFYAQETKLLPVTTSFIKLLFRTPIKRVTVENTFRYENELLTSYRDMLQKKIQHHYCKYKFISKYGFSLSIHNKHTKTAHHAVFFQKSIDANMFLNKYRKTLQQLKANMVQIMSLKNDPEIEAVLNTLIPLLAFLKKHSHKRNYFELLEYAIDRTLQKIETLL